MSGFGGVLKYIKDYSTLITGGLIGNLSVTYLGSYGLNWSVMNKTEDQAFVMLEVTNSSTIESGTRPPVLGYTDFWKKILDQH